MTIDRVGGAYTDDGKTEWRVYCSGEWCNTYYRLKDAKAAVQRMLDSDLYLDVNGNLVDKDGK